ncbi:MAG: TolB family protein [Dehalococcoidia bacterium]
MQRRVVLIGGGVAMLVAAAAIAVFLINRNEDSTTGQTPPAQPLTERREHGLLLVRNLQLLLRDMTTGVEYEIKKRPTADTYYAYPRWKPDGSQIAYVIAAQIGAAGQNVGSDVAVSNTDGSDERIVFTHEKPGTTVEGIDWSPDGQALYLTIIEPEIRDGRFVGSTMRLDRLDLASGGRTTIAEGAAYPTVAPDGSRIAYLTYSGGDRPPGMWTARPDGSDARLIVPLGADIAGLRAPRFSPDSQSLAFGAVETADANLMAAVTCGSGSRWPWQPPVASAHGPPVDLWMVAADGTGLRKLEDLNEDDPSVAWSPDGSTVAALGTCGLFLFPLDEGRAEKIAPGALLSQMDWR